MTLTHLLEQAGVSKAAFPNMELSGDARVTAIALDSRLCRQGSVFVCMPRLTHDAEGFIPDAAKAGCSAVIVSSVSGFDTAKALGLAALRIPDSGGNFERAIWKVCDAFHQHPTRNMKAIATTGTNGKTTTAWLMRDMLNAVGYRSAYLGTLGFQLLREERELNNTTPFAVDLYNMIAEARDRGIDALSLEISSHALAQQRADGLEFDAAVFTNFTQDHLDFHGSMEEYAAAKFRLFSEFPERSPKAFTAVMNCDDELGTVWAERLSQQGRKVLRYGIIHNEPLASPALTLCPEKVTLDRIQATLTYRTAPGGAGETANVTIPIGGKFNLQNALAAAAGLLAIGVPFDRVMESLTHVRPVPGRFEPVPNNRGIGILVDYAHTPDGMQKLLESVRDLRPHRIITVFGCGGDRDAGKRPQMGKVASLGSDFTVVTSDNPRTEDPQTILDQVAAGIPKHRPSKKILSRRDAVSYAIHLAEPGDIVVLAGKGHENYQIVGHTKHLMDDRLLAKAALR